MPKLNFGALGPDPMLAAKLLNMSREHLGWCIQFFTGHGWWKKHLKLANLCNDNICRLCKRPNSIKSHINLFTECTELSAIRQELFNDPYPSQLVIHNQLCQVTEFALIGRVCDLINIDKNHFNVSSSRVSTAMAVKTGGNGFFGTCPCFLCSSISLLTPENTNVENKQTTLIQVLVVLAVWRNC